MNDCPACGRVKNPAHYLCSRCWYSLGPTTRKSLWRKDSLAAERLRELYQAIQRDIPLADIKVTP
jgi:hypothetical protein